MNNRSKNGYSDREKQFHCDRKSTIELNGAYVVSPEVESDDIPQGAQVEILRFEYCYECGDMVAARPDGG